jgi:hypothetical protein
MSKPLHVGAVLTLALAACGVDSSPTLQPTPTPTPAPVRSVVAAGSFTLRGPAPCGATYFRRVTIDTARAGVLEITVDWTYSTNTLWMYVAEGDCTSDQFAGSDCPGPACACRFSVVSEQVAPKPRVLTVPTAAPGMRALIVWNHGPREESCSYQAVLTSAAATLRVVAEQGAAMPKRLPPRLSGNE